MKLNMVIATLVCGMAFCSSSYGFDLLNRMMGRSCCGGHATTCCDTPVDAGCGCNDGCGGLNFNSHVRFGLCCPKFGNFFNHGCGCDAGCAPVDPCCGGGLLRGGLFHRHGCCDHGCDTGCGGAVVADGCGCDAGCGPVDPCCGGGLFGGLFGRRGCGCGAGCGHVVDAGCGCNDGCGVGGCCGGGLFRGLFARRGCCGSHCGGVIDAGCGCNGTYGQPTQAQPAEGGAEGQVIEPEVPGEGGQDSGQGQTPNVDPNAFIVPNRRIAGGAR